MCVWSAKVSTILAVETTSSAALYRLVLSAFSEARTLGWCIVNGCSASLSTGKAIFGGKIRNRRVEKGIRAENHVSKKNPKNKMLWDVPSLNSLRILLLYVLKLLSLCYLIEVNSPIHPLDLQSRPSPLKEISVLITFAHVTSL